MRLVLAAIAMMLCAGAEATSFTDDTFTYTVLDESALTVSVAKLDATISGTIVIPSTVTSSDDGKTYTVTTIASMGFNGCSDITSVYIPNSITDIKLYYAFRNCTSLQKVEFEEGSTVTQLGSQSCFNGCTALKSINLPSSLTSLGNSTFSGCTSIETMTIPSSVTTIDQSCFNGCTALTKVSIPSSVTAVNQKAFYGCTALTDIYMHAETVPSNSSSSTGVFDGDMLTDVTLHVTSSSVASLFSASSWWAFSNISTDVDTADGIVSNSGTGDVEISDSTTDDEEDDDEALQDSLKSVTLVVGDSIVWQEIQYEVLTLDGYNGTVAVDAAYISTSTADIPGVFTYGNYSLMVTEVHAYNTSVYKNGQTTVKTLVIPGTVSTIKAYAFCRATNLTKLTILDSDTALVLNDHAFYYCYSLSGTIELPARVTSVGDHCFEGDYSISKVTLNEGITSIGVSAFNNISNPTSLTIPSTVTSVGLGAFSYWDGLTEIYSYAVNVPTTASGSDSIIFSSSSGDIYSTAHLHVPVGSAEAYAASEYWQFDKIIEGYEETGGDTLEVGDKIVLNDITYVVHSLSSGTATGSLYIASSNKPSGDVVIPATMSYEDDIANYTLTVDSLQANAFRSAVSMTSVTLPNTIKGMGSNAFIGCTSLTQVTFEEGGSYELSDYCFCNCTALTSIELPSWLKTVPSLCFANDAALASVTFGENLTYITKDAFRDCSALTSVTIPSTVTSVNGFRRCTGLTSITLNEGITEIEDGAFEGCTGLVEVTLPSTTTAVCGFMECTGITAVSVPDATTSINDYAFYGCTALANVTIGSGLQTVGSYAFGKTAITSIALPDALPSIGDYAFYSTNLEEIDVPDSVTSIGMGAFYGCSDMKTAYLSTNLQEVGYMSFEGCQALTDVYAYTTNPPSMIEATLDDSSQDLVFSETTLTSATLHVPEGASSNYSSNDYWAFSTIVEMVDETETGSTTASITLTADTPEDEGQVESLSEIYFTSSEEAYLNSDTTKWAEIMVYSKTLGTTYTVSEVWKDKSSTNRFGLSLSEEITDECYITLNLPEGLVGDLEAYNSSFKSGNVNASAVFSYQITSATTSEGVTVDPAEGEVDTLSVITVTFNDNSVIGISWDYYPQLLDADGKTVYKWNLEDDAEIPFDKTTWTGSNYCILTLPTIVTTAGTYTLYIPAGTFILDDVADKVNEELSFTYIIPAESTDDTDDTGDTGDTDDSGDSTGIYGIKADANGMFNVYSITGLRVMTTSNGSDIKNLPAGLYIINGKKTAVK